MMLSKTYVFLARIDNIGVLVHDPRSGATAAIDAPDEGAVLEALKKTGWQLSHILVTHKHADHIEAILPLKRRFPKVHVVAPYGEREAIPAVDVSVKEKDVIHIGALAAQVIETPGHTQGHVSYWFADDKLLFAGDTLFSMGCGRLFEGDSATMWESLKKLRALPDETQLFCGHEYTLSNSYFALTLDPDNEALKHRIAVVEATRAAGKLTIPTLLGDEKMDNPFLRADDPQIAACLGLSGKTPAEIFAALRMRKDNF